MKIVVDTNVLISGVFFGGWPYRVLEGWRDGRVELVVSPAILEEYRAVGKRLSEGFPGIDIGRFLEVLSLGVRVCGSPPLPAQICDDPDDDKFLACALASNVKVIVSGDLALQRASGYGGIRVMSPRRFVAEHLR